jgi:hypothetical protein
MPTASGLPLAATATRPPSADPIELTPPHDTTHQERPAGCKRATDGRRKSGMDRLEMCTEGGCVRRTEPSPRSLRATAGDQTPDPAADGR